MKTKNIFKLPKKLPSKRGKELFKNIFKDNNITVERIISTGQTSPEKGWCIQTNDELVFLLEGLATIEFERKEIIQLQKGDYLLIPALNKHRVIYTSNKPPCIWLAIHIK